MTALPTSIADFVLPNVADKKWLNDCVEGNNTFPSHNTKGFLLYGTNGCGKTNLACALPTLIEYANASAKDKVAYNFEYVFDGETVSITPNQQHLPSFNIITNFVGCGSLRAKDVDELIEEIDRDMRNQKYIDAVSNQQFQYFIVDEYDELKTNQSKFKALMTQTHWNKSIFILTTNHIDKVEIGVKDRLKPIRFGRVDAETYKPILTKYVPKVASIDFNKIKKAIDLHNGSIRQMVRFCETL